jgi:ABC-type branched-subunit amino acid transport system permease subunit
LGLNVVIGFAGLLALGQAAFYGFGAYASAIAVMQYDVPYLGALLIAAVVPLVIGLLLAIPFCACVCAASISGWRLSDSARSPF